MEVNLQKEQYYEEKMEYGGFWIRFVAYFIDSIIIGIPLAILAFIIFVVFFGANENLMAIISDPDYVDYGVTEAEALSILGSYLGALGVIMIINLVVWISYFAGMHSSKWQATLGKKMLGLKVADLHGNRITFWRALGRYLAMSFLSGILLIGYIIAAFTEKKQSLHDFIASTVVIKNS